VSAAVLIRQIKFGSDEYGSEVQLRYENLRKPLGLEFSREELDKEQDFFHFGAFDGAELIGCLVLVPLSQTEINMRQVAVIPDRQGQGIGKRLVQAAEEYAREKGFEWMKLHARETAVPFYLSLGYEIYSDPFFEVTIPHRSMRKRL